jgi:hypothetical protein
MVGWLDGWLHAGDTRRSEGSRETLLGSDQRAEQQNTRRTQITTDGLNHYRVGVPDAFGLDVDFAQLVKLFGDYGQHEGEARYSPSSLTEVISKVRSDNPDPKHISTSFVERQNLTMIRPRPR